MTAEQLMWGGCLLIAALVIVVLNDKMKPKKAAAPEPTRSRSSSLPVTAGTIASVLVYVIVMACQRSVPGPGWLILAIPVGVVTATLLSDPKAIWLLLKHLLQGKLPQTIRRTPDGRFEGKCSECSAKVAIQPGLTGDLAYVCQQCGSRATWGSDMDDVRT